MQTRRVITIVSTAVAAVFGVVLVSWLAAGSKRTDVRPYQNSGEMMSDIIALRPIGTPGAKPSAEDWSQYIQVAANMRVTDTELVREGLRKVATNKISVRGNIEREMILLRICFECSKGATHIGIHGGFFSDSAATAGRTNLDMNWPVQKVFGSFILTDTINGYLGPPYDPVGEFDWFLTNGTWRSL